VARLLLVGALSQACGRGPRQLPVGLGLDALPAGKGAPLVALTPTPVLLVAALRNPRETMEAIEGSELARQMQSLGLFDDAAAWPWLERWRVLRARLGELSRQPVPELRELLEAPAVISVSPGGSWLYVARTSAGPAVAFAVALNGVHPSGREVELDRRHGVPLRLVRFGEGRVIYYVLADRLVLGDDLALLQRSLDLFFGDTASQSALSIPRFAALEAQAQAAGLALAVDGARAPAPLAALGLRSLTANPDTLSADFDPQRWGLPSGGGPQFPPPVGSSGMGLSLDLSGLQTTSLWQAMRPAGATSPLLAALDGVSAHLGRGSWLRVQEEADGRLAFTAWLAWLDRPTTDGQTDSKVAELAGLLLAGPVHATGLGGGGTRWCAEGGGLCLAACPRFLGLTNRQELLAAIGCPQMSAPSPEDPWLAVQVSSIGKHGPLFFGSISPQGGRLRWAGQ
jgi:hypothetical protein